MDEKTKALVEAAEKRAEAATPGPWEYTRLAHDDRPDTEDVCDMVNDAYVIAHAELCDYEDDGAFIAAARSDIPALCAAVREMDARHEAERKAWLEERAQWQKHFKAWFDFSLALRDKDDVAKANATERMTEAGVALNALGVLFYENGEAKPPTSP